MYTDKTLHHRLPTSTAIKYNDFSTNLSSEVREKLRAMSLETSS